MQKFITSLIILMGISCFTGQVLFIREFLIQFYGNELTIGLILANWLMLEAAGSFVFGLISSRKKSPLHLYAIIQILISVLLPLGMFAARIIKTLLPITSGQGFDITTTFFFSLLVMSPLGFLLGGQFPLISRLYKDASKKSLPISVGKSYFLEAIGFGFGGIVITYFLIPNINSIAIAFIIGWINLIAGCLLITLRIAQSKPLQSRWKIKTMCVLLVVIGIFGYIKYIPALHNKSVKMQWKDFVLIDYGNSIHGNIAVIKQAEQHVFYYDGLPFMSTPMPDIVFIEDFVNFAVTAVDNPKDIAIIGSGLGGIINDVLKYPVKRIDYAELDPMVIQMAKKHTSPLTKKELDDPRVKIHYIDGRLFLKQTKSRFDLVIINLPLPSTLIINRFYTQEFFDLVRRKLNTSGIVCLSLPGSLSYLSDEQIDINKCILETLKSVFPQVRVIPGYSNLYLASTKNELIINAQTIIERLKKNKIRSPLFNRFYVEDRLENSKRTWFQESLKKRHVRLNKDLEPTGVFYSLGLWNALFSPKFQKIFRIAAKLNLALVLMLICACYVLFAIGVYLFKRKKDTNAISLFIPSLVLSSGFTGVSLNLIILLALQTFYGFVYFHIGILISSFMFGLTTGGALMTKNLNSTKSNLQQLLKVDLFFMVFCIAMHPFLILLSRLVTINAHFPFLIFLFILSSFFCGFFVGFEFPLSNKIYLNNKTLLKKPANILYAVDMLGSFWGAILISIILIPVLGISNTILVIFFIKFCSFTLLKIGLRWKPVD